MPLSVFKSLRETDPRVLREQLRTQHQTLPMTVAGSVFIVVLWATVISFWVELTTVIWWSIAMLLQFGFWHQGALRYRQRSKSGPLSDESVRRMTRHTVWGSLLSGCLWGVSSVLFFPSPGEVHVDYQYLLMLTLAGLVAGAAFSQGSYLPAFYAYAIPCATPIIALLLLQGILIQAMFAFSAIFFILVVMRMAQILNQTLLSSFETRFANEDLVKHIAQQHQTVTEASAAKSKFLASASHDLRQPLHAMELFIEALRQFELAEAPRQITEKLRGSTTAMRELLDALLDISKLDAGVVQPQIEVLDLQRLAMLVCEQHRSAAELKGIELRLNIAPKLATQSDPGLLRSILSNLVSNAIRYTDTGGVLVSCRSRKNEWLIDVIDTGHGIAQEQQREIFKEFIQLHNPQRDRTQGLGLGLAIVRRLASLLDHQIELRSTPGRGSRFRIHLDKQPWTLVPAEKPRPQTIQLRAGALVVVVDDEANVRDAMATMLSAWGLRSLCHPDADSALLALADEAEVPLLLISDYRLGGSTNGIQVIAYLRSAYNADSELPALLITGDTGSADLRVAKESGILVMHKPIDTEELRRLLGRLSQERDGRIGFGESSDQSPN